MAVVSITAAPADSSYTESAEVKVILAREDALGLNGLEPYQAFAERTAATREELRAFVRRARAEGRRVAFLGASTKGNVLLQYCGFTADEIEAVGEVNPDKFGTFTPGTLLPIVDEKELLKNEPDVLIVLPWHFRTFFLEKFKLKKAQMVFPLPRFEIIPPGSPD